MAAVRSVVRPSSVRLILGTMTFGGQTSEDVALQQLRRFAEGNTLETRDRVELDTARMYMHGGTEELLGRIFRAHPDLRDRFIVGHDRQHRVTTACVQGIHDGLHEGPVVESEQRFGLAHAYRRAGARHDAGDHPPNAP